MNEARANAVTVSVANDRPTQQHTQSEDGASEASVRQGLEIVIESRRHRSYTGSIINEYVLLTKKFSLIAPLFLSGFCCSNWTYNDYDLNLKNVFIQLATAFGIILVDRVILYPSATFAFFCTLSLAVNNSIVYYVFHQYVLYGIVWSIGVKLCDFEDAQRLFPGFALLHTPSVYINALIQNKRGLTLIIPYVVILGYIFVFHQKWKHEYVYSLDVSKRTQWWWFMTMSSLCVSHWGCFSQLTNLNIIKENELFDVYKYMDIEYVKYKGICTFVVMFVTNSQVFSSFSWRNVSLFLGFSLFVLKMIDYFFPFEKYNVVDTISFGISFYMFEPLNAIVYTTINRANWWNMVPINVLIKLPVLYFLKFVPEIYSLFVFVPLILVYMGLVVFINEEFKPLDI